MGERVGIGQLGVDNFVSDIDESSTEGLEFS